MERRPHSLATQIAEVERELVMRRRNYPRWVAAHKMTAGHAELQIAIMESVLATLRELREARRAAIVEEEVTS